MPSPTLAATGQSPGTGLAPTPRLNQPGTYTAMTSIDVNSVLAQIRTMGAQARVSAPKLPETTGTESVGGFGSLIRDSINGVNARQQEAGKLQDSFELGDPNTDLASVMLASGKAQVAFRAMVEVRNRAVSAYQEIMNMPL